MFKKYMLFAVLILACNGTIAKSWSNMTDDEKEEYGDAKDMAFIKRKGIDSPELRQEIAKQKEDRRRWRKMSQKEMEAEGDAQRNLEHGPDSGENEYSESPGAVNVAKLNNHTMPSGMPTNYKTCTVKDYKGARYYKIMGESDAQEGLPIKKPEDFPELCGRYPVNYTTVYYRTRRQIGPQKEADQIVRREDARMWGRGHYDKYYGN